MSKLAIALSAGGLTFALLSGCMESLSEQGKADPNIVTKKTTQDIQKFDPNAKQEVSDSKVRASDPMFYALEAYRPIVEQGVKAQIDYAIRLFEAENGRYPKDYNEFMTKIIKANNIRLPVLPGGWKYAYDEKNHKLETIHAVEPGAGAPGPASAQPVAPDK